MFCSKYNLINTHRNSEFWIISGYCQSFSCTVETTVYIEQHIHCGRSATGNAKTFEFCELWLAIQENKTAIWWWVWGNIQKCCFWESLLGWIDVDSLYCFMPAQSQWGKYTITEVILTEIFSSIQYVQYRHTYKLSTSIM